MESAVVTYLEIILENKALLAYCAIVCIAAVVFLSRPDDWVHLPDGFAITISPVTALVGCLAIILLSLFFPKG